MLGFVVQCQRSGHHVRQPARLGDVQREEVSLFGDRAIQLDAALEEVQHRAHESLGLPVGGLHLRHDAGPHHQIGLGADKLHDLDAAPSLDKSGVRAIRHLQQATHSHLHPHRQKIIRTRVIQVGIVLRQADHSLFLVLCFLHGQQRSLAPDKDRGNHARENDQVAQRQDRGFDHAILVRLPVGDAVQLLCALREGQVKIVFFFVPFFRMTHFFFPIRAGSADPCSYH